MSKRYFPHIDGLRALAVIAVVFFHYRIPYFSGGYIGVDIFFVISGFLISGIIQRNFEKNNFRFYDFYKKRFYRIYPALLFSCALTFIIAAFLFSPTHMEHLGKNLLGALSFTSNFIYWRSVGYFQVLDGYDPFIPTWSLSIEMQYYILFPPFYIILLKLFKRRVEWVMLFAALASLALTEVFSRFTSNFVYYNLPFRFFEFSIGTLCFHILQKKGHKPLNTALFPLIGTLLIVVSVVCFDEQTPFPGIWALLPCIGTALIILSDHLNVTYKIYDNHLTTYIGKISYSLYLIHWPVYVLFAYWYYSNISITAKLGLFVASCLLAVFMHHFIENSYRHSVISLKRKALLFACSLLVLIGSYSAYHHNGWAWRLSPAQTDLLEYIKAEEDAFKRNFDQTFPESGETVFIPEKHGGLECSYNNTKDPNVLLPCLKHNLTRKNGAGYLIIGDSNGANTYRSMTLAYPDLNFAMLQQAGCAAASYLEDKRSGAWCFRDLREIVETLHAEKLVHGIILSSRWVMQPYQKIGETNYYNAPVMIIGPTPTLRHDTFETLFMLGIDNFDMVKTLPIDGVGFQKDVLRAEDYLKQARSTLYISKIGLLCLENNCPIFIGDEDLKPLFLDDQHLSSAGILYLSEQLKNNTDIQEFFNAH
ncbi:MAG: acyltransferase family protein [Alphaproteobacteria bacterium]